MIPSALYPLLNCMNSINVKLIWYNTRMWANAKRDGRPAEYRWRPLFSAAKFGWRPLLECRAVTLPRREIRWNLQGVPQTTGPILAASRPKFTVLWGHHVFSNCRYVPQLRRYNPTTLYDDSLMAIFGVLYFQRAACSTLLTCILNLH